jgi:hypothetical protein
MRIAESIELGLNDNKSPYRGLMPFTEDDESFFFGRSADTDIISANLIASRLTIVYGPTGVGKSSVLRAGVLSALHKTVEKNRALGRLPEMLPVYFNRWSRYSENPTKGVLRAIQQAASRVGLKRPAIAAQLKPDGTRERQGTLCSAAEVLYEETDGPMLLILDQFEEYFLYNTADSNFQDELVSLVLSKKIKANCILSLREDSLALLDRFKGRLPFLLDNIVRVNYLDRAGGKEAISRPIDALNRFLEEQDKWYSVEPQLLDAVLDEVTTGKLAWESEMEEGILQKLPAPVDAREILSHREIADSIETSFLQIVMTEIWEREVNNKSKVLRLSTLKDLKGAKTIVQSHVSDALSRLKAPQRRVIYRCLRYLVTPSGTKIALNADDLANFTGMQRGRERKIVNDALGELSSARLLRRVADKYEIYHDILAPAILEWRRRYAYAQRYRLVWASVFLALGVLLFTAGYFFYKGRQRAHLTNILMNQRKDLRLGDDDYNAGIQELSVGDYKESVASFVRAESKTKVPVPPYVWNTLCWKGALSGAAVAVQPACARAVRSAPTNIHYLDSRGLDFALVGNREAAIQDFEQVVKNSDTPTFQRQQRTAWIKALQNGENPFTRAVIASLKHQ